MSPTLTAKDLLVTEGILTSAPGETLSQALAKLNSSHDAVFVVEGKNVLLGVISPYYVMFQSNYPPTTKLRHCLFHPPKLSLDTPIWEIARKMVQSKVYFLPVFSKGGEWLGIVSVRRLMQAVVEESDISRRLEMRKRSRRMITLSEDASLNEARALLRNGGVSRLPVVNDQGKVVGILTRYDLREAFSAPRSSQRFLSRVGQKRKYFDQPILRYYKRQVQTARQRAPLTQLINQMLEQRIGSVLIVNPKWQPIAILSYRDILEAISDLEREGKEAVSLTAPEDYEYRLETLELLEKLIRKLVRRGLAEHLEVNVETSQDREENTRRYQVTIRTQHSQLGSLVARDNGYDWKTAVRGAIGKIGRQTDRD